MRIINRRIPAAIAALLIGTDHAQYASIVSERLNAATTRELQARGFRLVDREPDLLAKFPLSKEG